MKKITEGRVIAALARPMVGRNLILPRFTPDYWWECDLCVLTKAGYFKEYEVKLTKADFLADVKKNEQIFKYQLRKDPRAVHPSAKTLKSGRVEVFKHQLLDQKFTGGPSQFWYVTPHKLVDPQLLPTWAGLIEFDDSLHTTEVVRALQLHRVKAPPELQTKLLRNTHFRFINNFISTNS